MRNFQQALEECELMDSGFSGPKYTWSNCWEEMEFIKEWLDRGVANQAWRDLFPEAALVVELALGSDHLPILVCLDGKLREKKRAIFSVMKLDGPLRRILKKLSNEHGMNHVFRLACGKI
jgi:hypothetical protein